MKCFFVLDVIPHRAILCFDVTFDFYGFMRLPREVKQYRPYFKTISNLHNLTVLPAVILSPKGVRLHVRDILKRQAAAVSKFALKRMKGFRGPMPHLPPA